MKSFCLFLILMLLFITCQQSTEPLKTQQNLSYDVLKKLKIELVGYDSLMISNPDQAISSEREITRISIRQTLGGMQTTLKEVIPIFQEVNNGYQLKFDIPLKVDKRTVYADLSIEFIKESDPSIVVDTSVAVFKFPYPETELLYYQSELLPDNLSLQSFDFVQDKIYMHGYGPSGLYVFDMAAEQQKTLLGNYGAGDHLAAADDRIFLDIDHNKIYVFDLNSGQLSGEPIIVFQENPPYDITGMTIIGQKLYVLYGHPHVYVYDFQGNLLQTIPYGNYTYGLTHKNNILYSVGFNDTTFITKFDLQTQSFLEPIPAPTSGTDIVQIKDDYLYFTDYYKQILARVPLSVLE